MPVPTPPNKDLFKVTPPKPKFHKSLLREDSKTLDDQIKRMTVELATALGIPESHMPTEPVMDIIEVKHLLPQPNSLKKVPFVPPEHLTQSPFRENEAMRKLQYELKKETDPKKPVKRSPKRMPANKTTGVK